MRRIAVLTSCLAVVAVAAIAPASIADSGNKYPSKTITHDCGNGDSIAFSGATKLWPPNHKYRTVTVTAHEANPTPYSFTDTVTSNEGELDPGSGHTVLDANPPAGGGMGMGPGDTSQDHGLRGERDGGGSGRTYTIDVKADFEAGANHCETSFTVTVPHDMRNG